MTVAEWWEQLRAHLPLRTRSYLFAGAQTPLADDVRRAIIDTLDRWEHTGWHIHQTEWSHLCEAEAQLAALTGCEPDQIAHTCGTTDGLNLAGAAVLARWRLNGSPPANVVLHHQSHAAASYAWLNAVRLGAALELRWADPASNQTAADALAERVDGETLAVVTSHVSNWDGERLDLPGLAARFPDRHFALLTDAAQSAGALPLPDVVSCCDFVAMPAYKWLLGPAGVGFLVVGRRWLADPGPPSPGWAGMEHPLPIQPRSLDPAPSASSYRLGIPNFLGIAGAAAGLHLLNAAGPARIAERIRVLTERLNDQLRERSLRITSPAEWPHRAGVVTVWVRQADQVASALEEDGIVVGVEQDALRIDVHAYNSDEDIDRLLVGLDRHVRPASPTGAH